MALSGSGNAMSGFAKWVCAWVARLLCMLAVAGLAARSLPEDLQALPYVPAFVSFTPWFALAALVALALALWSRRWVSALVALVCVCALGAQQAPYSNPSENFPQEARQAVGGNSANIRDRYARVMTANVYKGHADPQAIVELVKEQRVEVLALQETTTSFIRALRQAGIGYYLPYSQVSSSQGYGNGLWSATPLSSPVDDEVGSTASPMPGGTVTFGDGGGAVRFVSVHTVSPKPGQWDRWRQSIDDVSRLEGKTVNRYVMMGDFNASTDHAPFRRVISGRFSDAAQQAGHGLVLTWPCDIAHVPKFVGIDHVVVDRGITAGQVESKPLPGSDHAALLATIAL